MKDHDNYGLGMAAASYRHQKINFRIAHNYQLRFDDEKMFMCAAICHKPERIPDISVWETVYEEGEELIPENPLMSIEITRNKRNDKDSDKSIIITFQNVPTLQESFIYNYMTDNWTRYTRKGDNVIVEEDKDYSRVLKCYLHTLL